MVSDRLNLCTRQLWALPQVSTLCFQPALSLFDITGSWTDPILPIAIRSRPTSFRQNRFGRQGTCAAAGARRPLQSVRRCFCSLLSNTLQDVVLFTLLSIQVLVACQKQSCTADVQSQGSSGTSRFIGDSNTEKNGWTSDTGTKQCPGFGQSWWVLINATFCNNFWIASNKEGVLFS